MLSDTSVVMVQHINPLCLLSRYIDEIRYEMYLSVNACD